LAWTVPEDIASLKFGCTIPGHYETMQGTFSVAGEFEPSIVGDPGVMDVEPKVLCDPSDPNAASCRSDALATTVAEFEEQYSALVRDQNDAWRAGDDPAPPNLALAQWADDFIAALEALGFSEEHPSEMAALMSAYAAYAQYTRDHAAVILSDRPEEEVLRYIRDRQQALNALTQAVAPAQ